MQNETKAQKWSFLKHWTQVLIIRCWLMDEQTYPQLCINKTWSIIFDSVCVCKDICVYLHKYIHIYLHMYKHMSLCVKSISLMDDSLNGTFVFKMCILYVCVCLEIYMSFYEYALTICNCWYQFSHSVVSDSLRPHELQHARPACPSPGVYSNSHPSSQWCHPATSSSVIPFSSYPQSLPASGSFPMSQLFIWGGQIIGVSASASVLPMNTQDWFPLGWTGWISLQSKGLSRVFSNTTVQKHQFFGTQLSSQSNSHPYMTTGKTIALTRWTFVGKVMSLLFNMLSRLVITFLPKSKRLLISWRQSTPAVNLEPPQNKVWHCFHCLPIYFPWSDGIRCHDVSFLNVEL